jgi:hypothetical protein
MAQPEGTNKCAAVVTVCKECFGSAMSGPYTSLVNLQKRMISPGDGDGSAAEGPLGIPNFEDK